MKQTFKPKYIKGKPIHPNSAIEKATEKKIMKLTRYLVRETRREVKKIFEDNKSSIPNVGMDASIASQARIIINALSKRMDKIFGKESLNIANIMANRVNGHLNGQIKQSVEELSKDLKIDVKTLSKDTKEIIKASVNQAADYIKSIQSQYLTQVKGDIYRAITEGQGLKDVLAKLSRTDGVVERRAKNIALDQFRKVNSNVTRAKMEDAGITKAIWHHSSAGLEPRKSHVAMDGKIYDIKKGMYDPEVGYYIQVSQLPNCRCFSSPVVEI